MKSYLESLNPEQRAAVEHVGSPLLILAGAGSGKTRVITVKIAYLIQVLGYDPESILAVTFTNKAAKEMRERAIQIDPRAERVMIKTFHSFGSWFLRRNAHLINRNQNFTIYDDDDMVSLLQGAYPSELKSRLSLIAKSISRAKDYLLNPSSLDLDSISSDYDFDEFYKRYEERLQKTGNVDFGDLIKLPVDILNADEQLRKRVHQRFKVILVDEYQDSNVAQFELLKALTGSETFVCVVGDDDQSIYRFRGAEVKNILTFSDTFPGTKIVKLEKNYRSTQAILSCADSVVSHNEGRLGKTLTAVRTGGLTPKIASLDDQDAEVMYCAKEIQSYVQNGGSYSDCAILYRTNAQSLGFETDFVRRGIPFKIVGSLKFYDREEVKDALALLSLIVNPNDEVSFKRIVNKPARGIGDTSLEKILSHADTSNGNYLDALIYMAEHLSKKAKSGALTFAQSILSMQKTLGDAPMQSASILEETPEEKLIRLQNRPKTEGDLSLFIERVILESGILEYHKAQDEVQGSQKANNLYELMNAAALYPNDFAGLVSYLEAIELDRSLSAQAETTNDAVTLITMHNTKGLEFKNVFITGLELGLFPRENEYGEDLEEQRRLFYVAITRAMDKLTFSWCRLRRIHGRTDLMQPSTFLLELPKEIIQGAQVKPQAPKDPFKLGATVYHDDYGSGGIIKRTENPEGCATVYVQFESGLTMRFIPKYDRKLEIIG